MTPSCRRKTPFKNPLYLKTKESSWDLSNICFLRNSKVRPVLARPSQPANRAAVASKRWRIAALLSSQPLTTTSACCRFGERSALNTDQLPLSFVPNSGQTGRRPCSFAASGLGYSLALTSNRSGLLCCRPEVSSGSTASGMFQMQLQGANQGALGTGLNPQKFP